MWGDRDEALSDTMLLEQGKGEAGRIQPVAQSRPNTAQPFLHKSERDSDKFKMYKINSNHIPAIS